MDWLVGGDRRSLAVDRIYDAAAESVAVRGLDRLSVDDIAERVGCSRATVYRYAGGKGAIRDAVLARAIQRIAVSVHESVAELVGVERVVMAIVASLDAIRGDPVSASALSTGAPTADSLNSSLTASPRLAGAASELAGLGPNDRVAAEWIVRVVLSLLYWPAGNRDVEMAMVRRFVAPAFSAE